MRAKKKERKTTRNRKLVARGTQHAVRGWDAPRIRGDACNMGITIDRATKYTSGGHLITRLPSADDIVPITTGDVIVITQRGSCHAKRRGERHTI